MCGMVVYPGQQFDDFGAGPIMSAVIKNENSFPFSSARTLKKAITHIARLSKKLRQLRRGFLKKEYAASFLKFSASFRTIPLLNTHDKEFLSSPSTKMAIEHVIYFFLVYTRFFAFIRDYTPIFGKYFHGKIYPMEWQCKK